MSICKVVLRLEMGVCSVQRTLQTPKTRSFQICPQTHYTLRKQTLLPLLCVNARCSSEVPRQDQRECFAEPGLLEIMRTGELSRRLNLWA